MKINYVKGDATNPIVKDGTTAIIPHVCNINGGWGAGFVLALSKKWKQPERRSRQWCKSQDDFCLGAIDMVMVEKNIYVANMLAQNGYLSEDNPQPLDYPGLELCMIAVAEWFVDMNVEIHGPQFGNLRAGGKWEIIEKMIEDIWIANGIPVTIYLWEGEK